MDKEAKALVGSNKASTLFIICIVAIIGGMILNFQEFLMGSPATVKNLLVTVVYMSIWIFVLVVGLRDKNRAILTFISVFWIITLLVSFSIMYANATGASVDWALPLAILLGGQWYGIMFFVGSFLTFSLVVAFISLVMFTASIITLVRIRLNK